MSNVYYHPRLVGPYCRLRHRACIARNRGEVVKALNLEDLADAHARCLPIQVLNVVESCVDELAYLVAIGQNWEEVVNAELATFPDFIST